MLNYPLKLSFKLFTFAPAVTVRDVSGQVVLSLQQKALALRQDIKVYRDEAHQDQAYQINADRIIGFSVNYGIKTAAGELLGTLGRKGMRSLWRATYQIADENGQDIGTIHETNPWVKVLDGMLEEIPFVGFLVALLFNPTYAVDLRGQQAMLVHKKPSLWARTFELEPTGGVTEHDEPLVIASVLTMVLHERTRQ